MADEAALLEALDATKDAGLKHAPVSDLEAERWVLGTLLNEPQAFDLVNPLLERTEFYKGDHGDVYGAICALAERREPVSAATVYGELRIRFAGEDKKIQAAGALIPILDGCAAPVANVIYWARRVHAAALARAAVITASWALNDIQTSQDSATARLERARAAFLEVARPRPEEVEDGSIDTVMRETFRQLEARQRGEVVGVKSGYAALDRLTNGFQRQEVSIIAGRPGFGKTSLAMNLLRRVCDPAFRGLHAVFFALEAQPADLNLNMLCSLAKVDTREARSGSLNQDACEALYKWAETLETWGIHYQGSSRLTLSSCRSRLSAFKAEGNCDIAFIDYLQLMHSPSNRNNRPRNEEVAEISRGLKEIAIELDIPIVAMAQLNRNAAEGKPKLSNLRESGSLEQDAALVLAISQGDDQDEYAVSGPINLLILKNRYGPVGDVQLIYDKATSNFTEAL